MEDQIIQLKAEIFDLQVKYGQLRVDIKEKIDNLNILLQKQEGKADVHDQSIVE